MICDLNVPGGSSATTLHVWRDVTNSQFVFDGIDEAGAPYDCRFPDWTVGGILPGSYWVEVIGTDQNDDVEFTTHFSGFEFTAGAGNDRAIGPLDGRYIVLDLGDGNDPCVSIGVRHRAHQKLLSRAWIHFRNVEVEHPSQARRVA